MLLLWVETGWIVELTIVVLGVEGSLGVLADLDEVGDELSVGEVLVKIILEVLDQVHMLLNEVVSSNSWEREKLQVLITINSYNLKYFEIIL